MNVFTVYDLILVAGSIQNGFRQR